LMIFVGLTMLYLKHRQGEDKKIAEALQAEGVKIGQGIIAAPASLSKAVQERTDKLNEQHVKDIECVIDEDCPKK